MVSRRADQAWEYALDIQTRERAASGRRDLAQEANLNRCESRGDSLLSLIGQNNQLVREHNE